MPIESTNLNYLNRPEKHNLKKFISQFPMTVGSLDFRCSFNSHQWSFYSFCRVRSGRTLAGWGPPSRPWRGSRHT